ncbi:hypothetical protein PG987_007556 [Apiospora arundinis]
MQASESDIELDNPSSEDSHHALDMVPLSHQPFAPDDGARHEPEAIASAFFEDALPRFDEPIGQFPAPSSTSPTPFTPFYIAHPLTMHTPINAQVEIEIPATPTNSSAAGLKSPPKSPYGSSLSFLEHPSFNEFCNGISGEEASTMESILRGDRTTFSVENHSRKHLRPLAPYSTQAPSVQRATPNLNLTLPFAGELHLPRALETTPVQFGRFRAASRWPNYIHRPRALLVQDRTRSSMSKMRAIGARSRSSR